MSPVTHLLLGWLVANTTEQNNRRERTLIAIAGVIPDIDGLGIIADVITRQTASPTNWFSDYHHIFGHNLGFAIFVSLSGFLLARRKWLVASLMVVSFHMHLLGDLAGSRSPDGYQWAIPYLLPFSNAWQLTWQGQWQLNAWQNFVITGVALALTFTFAIKRGYSPVEIFSPRADKLFIATLRKRFQKSQG
ncbi:MAG: metal-dependent hydrolase [Acidobacteriota bacterium]